MPIRSLMAVPHKCDSHGPLYHHSHHNVNLLIISLSALSMCAKCVTSLKFCTANCISTSGSGLQ